MLKVIEKRSHCHQETFDSVTLPYALRQKGRFKAQTDLGRDIGIFLPRGEVMREGEVLLTDCGKALTVKAQAEAVVTCRCDDWLTFARACYHLGNRHVPLQVGDCWLRFQPDHVLEEMVILLGLTVKHEQASFNPESGAYKGGHSHAHHH